MSHSEICPLCKGKGIIDNYKLLKSRRNDKCHGCDGKGWVSVEDKQQPYIRPYEPIYPWTSPPDWTPTITFC